MRIFVLICSLNFISSNINEINCTIGPKSQECNFRGNCVKIMNSTQCLCDDGYLSDPRELKKCTYEQKDTVIALAFEFFLGIFSGAGFFYLDLTGQGFCRFFVFLTFVVCFMIVRKFDATFSKTTKYVSAIIGSAIILIIWINDLANISKGIIDGNGFPVRALYYDKKENIIN